MEHMPDVGCISPSIYKIGFASHLWEGYTNGASFGSEVTAGDALGYSGTERALCWRVWVFSIIDGARVLTASPHSVMMIWMLGLQLSAAERAPAVDQQRISGWISARNVRARS